MTYYLSIKFVYKLRGSYIYIYIYICVCVCLCVCVGVVVGVRACVWAG